MTVEPQNEMPSTEVIGDQAAEWLLKQDAAQWSAQDQTELDAWLAQSPHHLAAYWRLKAGWTRAERLAALKPAQQMRPEKVAKPKGMRPFLRYAMAAIVVAVAGVGFAYNLLSQERVVATAVGQRAKFTLADGTHIELNTNSAIAAKITPWARTVELQRGEAFFDVRHDAARPFVVLAAGHRIVDLGTQFSVRENKNSLKVTLIAGRARLETANPALQHHATDLVPGDVAVVTANAMSVAKMPARALTERLAWRGGKLMFDHATLAEAAAEFNRYNDTKIVIAPDAAHLMINGTFDAGSVGPFTRMAQFAFGLAIEKRGKEIVVFRKKS
jgi:transmembrane sensor